MRGAKTIVTCLADLRTGTEGRHVLPNPRLCHSRETSIWTTKSMQTTICIARLWIPLTIVILHFAIRWYSFVEKECPVCQTALMMISSTLVFTVSVPQSCDSDLSWDTGFMALHCLLPSESPLFSPLHPLPAHPSHSFTVNDVIILSWDQRSMK